MFVSSLIPITIPFIAASVSLNLAVYHYYCFFETRTAYLMNRHELTRTYVQRLINLLVSLNLGDGYMALVADDMSAHLLQLALLPGHYNLDTVMAQLQQSLVARGKRLEWSRLQLLIEQLVELKRDAYGGQLPFSPEEQVARYLVFILSLPHHQQRRLTPQPRPVLLYVDNMSHRGLRIGKARSVMLGYPSLSSQSQQLRSRLPQRPSSSFGYPGSRMSMPVLAESMVDEYLANPDYTPMGPDQIRTLQYTLLGRDSKLIAFNLNDALVTLPRGLLILDARMLALITEAAILFKSLVVFCELNKGKLNSPIKMAFLSAVEDQLNLYLNFINDLFALGNPNGPSTLLGVYGPIMSYIHILRLLHGLVGHLDVNGYTFLSRVDELSKFGDRRIRNLCQLIFRSIVDPYYDILEHWILDGNLTDDLEEFFIDFDENASDFNHTIRYNAKMVPDFIPASVGAKIYQIGKTLIFLKRYCKQLQWVAEYRQTYDYIVHQQHTGLKDMEINDISQLVLRQYHDLLHALTLLLEGDENDLFAHIVNFKRFYLTQGSDFVDTLITQGQDMLTESLNRITYTQLSKVLAELIRTLSVKESRYQDRLEMLLSDQHQTSLGLDAFTIDYRIDDLSISYLFQSQISQYKKLYSFLFRVRVLGYALGENFVYASSNVNQDIASVKNIPMARWLPKTIRVVNCLRFTMVQFIDWLLYYLLFDVIEPSFERMAGKFFKTKVNSAQPDLDQLNPNFLALVGITSLQVSDVDRASHNMNELTIDEIISTHQDYLDQLLANKLLLESVLGQKSGRSYVLQIAHILETIEMYIRVLEEYFGLVPSYTQRVRLYNPDDDDVQMDGDLALVEAELKGAYARLAGPIRAKYDHERTLLGDDMRHDFDLHDYAI